jgi:predicted small secreted protein
MGLALTGSLLLFPVASAVHAAPGSGKAHGVAGRANGAEMGGNGLAIVVQVPNQSGAGQMRIAMPLEYIATIEGVSVTALQQDLQTGETLLQIAGGKYSTAQALATALLANVEAKLSRAPAGSMPNATQIYAALLSAVETVVTTPHPRITTMAVKIVDGKDGPLFDLDQVASVLGVSTTTLQQDLAAGQTLLQIAGSKFSSAQALATALLANVKTKLDDAAAAGKLTAAQESQQYAALLSQAETLVTTPHPRLLPAPGSDAVGSLANVKEILISTVATSCNTTTDALGAAVQAGGKSILQICQVTNPSATVTSLSVAIIGAAKSQLDAAVASGKITPSQESTVLAELRANLARWLTTPISAAGGDAIGSLANVKEILISTVATSCNTTTDALGAAVQAGGKSILQICQVTNPSATVTSLSVAITGAARSQLDAAVASGEITASQESAVLAELRANLARWLTTPIPQEGSNQQD